MSSEPGSEAIELRRKAIAVLEANPFEALPQNEADLRRLMHELQVHQIELKIQNEELVDAQNERQKVLERYTSLYEYAPAGYFNFNANGEILLVNLTGAKLMGLDRDKLHARRFALFVVPTDRLTFADFLVQVFASEAKQVCEVKLELENRSPLFVRLEGIVVPEVDECLVALIDITRPKLVEEALRLRNQAIHAVPQGIVITDPNQPDSPIIYVNPGFERITGYPAAEILGRNCRFLQGKDTDPRAVARMREAIDAVHSCTVELLNYRKDGTPFWNAMLITPVRDETGCLIHFVGVSMDVTGQRSKEEMHRQTQKMEAVGQLAGGIAHDFNNLLTVIDGYASLLMHRTPKSDTSWELLQEIRSASAHATYLTRQLLAFSRRQVLSPETLDLNALILENVALLKRLIGSDVTIETSLDPTLYSVWAERGQISQIVMNLVINARDAISGGGRISIRTSNVEVGEVTVLTEPTVQAGGYAQLSVSDTGCGMTEEVRERIFEPFFTTKPVGSGTGIGLATVHSVVTRTGGHIDVSTELGKGTTFKVYLPQLRNLVVEKRPHSGIQIDSGHIHSGHKTSEPLIPTVKAATILLVEDDDSVRQLASTILSSGGYQVLSAADGKQALRIAEDLSQTIDLLLSDVVMPGLQGPELVDLARKLRPGIRVLMMSGYIKNSNTRDEMSRSHENFIQKPFSPQSLLLSVASVLNAQVSTQSNA